MSSPKNSSTHVGLRPEISELIVLQMIYSLLMAKNGGRGQQVLSSSGGVNESMQDSSMSNSGAPNGPLFRVSLVKLTNEIQNNILINQVISIQENQSMNKIGINDILKIISNLFPGHKTSLVDGQISFHNLQLNSLRTDLIKKYTNFKTQKLQTINKLEERISSVKNHNEAPSSGAATPVWGTKASMNKVTKKDKSRSMMDPKREKLLQLYRDTVLNKLQGKSKIFDDLYRTIDENEKQKKTIPIGIVKSKIEMEHIKTKTPQSVHDLQLILQKSICDGLMRFPVGSKEWKLAKQVQLDFDDTVQFMRRALE
ncbi:hypothetical protein TPHA_0O00830 [Tetrapisispora phaffii CBS 4417]|uniref:Uncharacterized protein n=1 Tax=Tetrapisispora phaffii (strain ATCC 24235 / CBS 4417 / NBRC 1672 / NRRL Y-8282 / UCD 70-5) TaxID=1071381 RepID=G8C1M4_TETPH|nr:hypothetical protein TPHA_0O00830 [Tetrapisispora phaffii CBS 4417]CCE66052.1 hypothetical protein TPHA_0O00830 [Tetrapisispora phaffii CBS 4417]